MKPLIQNSFVAKSAVHRWGGFAGKDIRRGGIIEECPYIESEAEGKHPEAILSYLFAGQKKGTTMFILGYGAIYNHSDQSNAEYYFNDVKNVVVFTAKRNLKKGEEIFVDYGRDYWSSRKKNPK